LREMANRPTRLNWGVRYDLTASISECPMEWPTIPIMQL
jgi:hypothetical protein